MVNFKQLTKTQKLSSLVVVGVLAATGLVSLGESIKQHRVEQAKEKEQAELMARIDKLAAERPFVVAKLAEQTKLNSETAGEAQPEQSDPLAEWAVRQAESYERHDNECWDQIQSDGLINPTCVY